MGEPTKEQPINLGIYDKAGNRGISAAELIAIALSVLWLAAVALFFVFADRDSAAGKVDSLTFVMTLLAIFLPVAVIWIGAVAARSARIMRAEAQRLENAIDAMRHSYVAQSQTAGMGVRETMEQKLNEIAAAAKQTENAVATFATTRSDRTSDDSKPAVAQPLPPADEQGQTALALGTLADDMLPPVSVPDFIRALNFPENVDDKDGFSALRRALADRQTAKLIQASQDVLTLLSQEGIYMDDLKPDRARPEIWRKFAEGLRGGAISGLGGVRDRSSLALTSGRMKQDQIFRDAVHHFLREFDKTLAVFAANATDQDIIALSDTRSARAFMLLGRVTGTFD